MSRAHRKTVCVILGNRVTRSSTFRLMRKDDCGLIQPNPTQHRSRNIEFGPLWMIAGLVISIVTSLINPIRAGAQTSSPPRVTTIAATAISENSRTAAAAMFGDRCAVCHGPNGDGKGPGAANLNPKPVDFRDRKWQRSVTDAKISKAIVYGGPAVGLSSAMSANPDLEERPGVVAALVEHIRSLAGKRK
jgi:mono/diheme cytochrome c family protein